MKSLTSPLLALLASLLLPAALAHAERAPPDASDLVLRLVLNGKDANVYLRDADKWIEAMPGQFMLAGALTNGTIIGVTGKGTGSFSSPPRTTTPCLRSGPGSSTTSSPVKASCLPSARQRPGLCAA